MPSREEYERWIAATTRTQRRVLSVLGALAAVSIGLMFWRKTIGQLSLLFVAMTAVIAYWVTAAHLAEWRLRLRELARRNQANPKPPQRPAF